MENTFNKSTGLVNFGNTCFMNASIQLLMSARVLTQFLFFCDKYLNKSDITKYIQTWKDYMHPDTKVLGPKIIYHRYMILNKNYIGFTQEDSHEFLTFTLDDVIEQINLAVKSSEIEESKKEEIFQEVKKIYRLEFVQTVFYNDPKHENFSKPSITNVFENILTLPIDSNCTSLEECFNLYMIQNEPEFKLTFKLINLPKYIFVGLKRFSCSTKYISKINKPINIPFETNIFDGITNYRLKGFVMHSGSVSGGHYYSYGSRNIDGIKKWFCYNDSSVGEVSLEQVINELKNAYIFLYSRK